MLLVETAPEPRLHGPVKGALKRGIESRESLQEAAKAKRPRYAGTIYEAMLAPLAPATTPAPRRPPAQPRGDPALQADLASLVRLSKRAPLEEWLEEHAECVNLNLYSSEGLTPLQEVCQEGGEGSAELARLLVRFGADTRMASRDGWSPVHMASFSGNSALLLFLLSCRA
jgi:hypothetical protein